MKLTYAQKCTSVIVFVVSVVYLVGVRQGLLPRIEFEPIKDIEEESIAQHEETKSFLHQHGVTEDLFDLDRAHRIPILEHRVRDFVQKIMVQPEYSSYRKSDVEDFFRLKIVEFESVLSMQKITTYSLTEELSKTVEFPKLVQIDLGKVGDEVEIELMEGKTHKRITRAVNPPIFEIPDFLSADECDYLLDKAKGTSLIPTLPYDLGNEEDEDEDDEEEKTPISHHTLLTTLILGTNFTNTIRSRVAKLTNLPYEVMEGNEPIKAVFYEPEGHDEAHTTSADGDEHLPCCFQTNCADRENPHVMKNCCRHCRFATILYYLTDVEEGGEMAFPLADRSDDDLEEQMQLVKNNTWTNLSVNCYNSSVVVAPKKGKAVLWYNHFLDDNKLSGMSGRSYHMYQKYGLHNYRHNFERVLRWFGYLGKFDNRSHHGGCDIRKGKKWVANTCISGSTYRDRYKHSVFFDMT